MELDQIRSKIITLEDLLPEVEKIKKDSKKIVFTNGCFDIVHRGHIEYLAKASDFGDILVIGLNTDQSVKKLKGDGRPINDEFSRAILLASLQFIDYVVLFEEDTPHSLIKKIIPHVLIKGGDYKIEEIVGNEVVFQNGGKVITIPFVTGFSSTTIINKISKT